MFGLALGLASIVIYAASGYSRTMLVLWLAALVALAVFCAARTQPLPRIALADLVVPAILAAVLTPLYAVAVYDWPVQVGSDEVAIMTTAKSYSGQWGADPFGLSSYLGHPSLLFMAWGTLGNALGGITLENMRLLHGLAGLLAVAASYALFRQLLPRRWAVVATLVLGLNHSLFMLSRMAMRENTVVLVEVVALALLVRGLRHRALLHSYLGGVVAGLGFYVYFPARAVFVLWLLFLLALALWYRRRFPVARLVRLGGVAAAGFALVATPVIVAGLKASAQQNEQQRLALMVFADARKLQQQWVAASGEWAGVGRNVLFGLGAFNAGVEDHAWNYPNPGHGFVDPLTGALLWLGVLVVAFRIVRFRRGAWRLLPLIGFLAIWLALALLVNKAPNYPRLLIALPFVAYLVTEAVRACMLGLRRAGRTRPVLATRRARIAVVVAVVASIAGLNIAAAADFVEAGRESGDDIGSTGRYIQSHRDMPGIQFALATSERWAYYVWGFPWMWLERMRLFAHEGQVHDIVTPATAAAFTASPPFALFMSRELWDRAGARLRERYPQGRVMDVTPGGEHVVLEVFGRPGSSPAAAP